MIQSINVNDAMKHLKTIFNRFICFFKGHRWKLINRTKPTLYFHTQIETYKCSRCGKIKEEVI